MNIAQTQYAEEYVTRYHRGYQFFSSWIYFKKNLFVLFKIILQGGLVPVVSFTIILTSITGYVAAINYSMVRGAALKQAQKEIKIVETAVLQKETVLANARTIASLKKQKDIVLMENVDRMYYVLPNSSVAEAPQNQTIR